MKIGVFSGTFDPVHDGHLVAAEAAIEQYDLTHVLFVPEAEPRLKTNVTAFEHRWAMLELAIIDMPQLGLWRAAEAQHTAATLRDIKSAQPHDTELVVLVGEDAAPRSDQWPDGTPIALGSVQLVVLPRSHHSSAAVRAGTAQDSVPSLVLGYIREHGLYQK